MCTYYTSNHKQHKVPPEGLEPSLFSVGNYCIIHYAMGADENSTLSSQTMWSVLRVKT